MSSFGEILREVRHQQIAINTVNNCIYMTFFAD